jgi:large subunit ribosomal protein L10
MPNKEKETLVQDLTEKIKKNNGMVLTEYQGLTVAEISELRAKLRPVKCEYKVIKNTLSKIALKNAGLESFAKYFSGPTAVAIENGDPVSAAKVLIDFSKEHNSPHPAEGDCWVNLATRRSVTASPVSCGYATR